jgi:type IV pilus assembly protein PilC
MLFNYEALDNFGKTVSGSIEAISADVAIGALQKRGLVIISIESNDTEAWYEKIHFGASVSNKDIVILSKQMATLFEAQVSPLKIFTLLASEVENVVLRKSLEQMVNDIQGGATISKALSKHPDIFSDFYVNMVKSGEETGKLNETFSYLAEHLDRNYEVVSKVKNALIYPAFVITVFLAVMVLMFTVIIPKISTIIVESGQAIPFYTQVVFAISSFFINYGFLMLAGVVVAGYFLARYLRTPTGAAAWGHFKLELPYLGELYRKLYLSVIADNMNTMLLSGITMVKGLEVTKEIVDNDVYKAILTESLDSVKGGKALSASLSGHPEIPGMLVQMIKVGEETGELGNIFKTMAKFYQREVVNAVDILVSLIEPVMIVFLGLSIGVLLASVLIPIYDIANSAGL